jgi:hypothetical protein
VNVDKKILIDAAGKNGAYQEARGAFEEVKRLNLANIFTYNVFLEYLILRPGGLEECKRVFNDGNLPIVINIERGIPHIEYTHVIIWGC